MRTIGRPLAILGLLCGVAAALRLHHLAAQSYWLDEALSLNLARMSWTDFARTMRSSEANMVLYYELLRGWVRIGGEGETWVRFQSCAAGVLTLPAMYGLGKRLFDRTTALVACAILALNTAHVWASQEARGYALVVLLTTMSWWLLLRSAAHRPGRSAIAAWAAYVVVATLSVYAHFYAALVVVAQGIVLLFVPMPAWRPASSEAPVFARASSRVVVACGIAFAGLLWPLALFLAQPHHNLDWISYGDRGLAARFQVLGQSIIHPTSSQGLAELGVLFVAGPVTVLASWRRREVQDASWRWALLLIWLFVPVAIPMSVSLALRPVVEPRYLAICLPPLILLAAGALTRLWRRSYAWAAFALLVAAQVRSLSWYYRGLENEDWRSTTAYVLTHARAGDYVVFVASYVRAPFNVYRRLDDPVASPTAAPIELPTWRTPVETAAAVRAHAARVWVVLSHNATPSCQDAVDDYLRRRFAAVDSLAFHLVQVRLYDHPVSTGDSAAAQSTEVAHVCS